MAELKTSEATKTETPGFSDSIIANLGKKGEGIPQRPNLFDVEIGVPAGGGGVNVLRFEPSYLPVLVQSFTTPTRELEVREFSYYGIKRKIPIRRKYGSFTMSFLQDDYLAINGWFEYWMDIIINPFNDYLEDYSPAISSGYVSLRPNDINGGYSATYKFLEAYPVQILPMQFDAATRNSTMRYEIMFNCNEYIFDGTNYITSEKSKPT